ncbi:MAG: Flp pilus assembly protein CpaB [Bryobacteraceae bacterium]|jgi:pilus assembly protein CpaB
MRRRLISVVLFAVLAALVSSTLIYKMISGSSQNAKGATAQVLVAVRDLDAGTLVADADVRPVDWPVTDGTHWIARRADVVGRAVLVPVAKDEPFNESRLAAKGAGAGLASRIPPGMRVVAVHVDELTGLSRFILPGMHVDVISTGSSGAQSGQGMVARTILQNIAVFSTGQTGDADAKAKTAGLPVFNLLVTPQQAEVLSLAVAQTRIQLVLRNPLDKGNFLSEAVPPVPPLPATPAPKAPRKIVKAPEPQPIPVAEKKAAPEPPPPLPTVEVIHGTKRSVSAVAVATAPEPQQ